MAAIACLALTLIVAERGLNAEPPKIERRLPPTGIELPADDRANLEDQLAAITAKLKTTRSHALIADVEIFAKAVELALQHGEFYSKKEIPRAYRLLKLCNERLEQLGSDQTPWADARGLVVRGYHSSIDGSAQPYGLVIPKEVDLTRQLPLYVWLHGRGDKSTDLHFIHQRLTSVGRIAPSDAIVLHPFGRQCMGFKSAGEIDVLEAIEHVKSQYKIDDNRIVLMGFSMGGAGAWHLGAHYADRWVAMSPGAGFAETALYNRIPPTEYPVIYEQTLWRLYDVPNYTRNLFNLPVVAYSGEVDKQIQAARVMERAFEDHGQSLHHLIGPGMGHKYHPDSLKQIMVLMKQAEKRGLNRRPRRVTLQTRTLRYNRMFWVAATGLKQHWQDTRIDAELAGDPTHGDHQVTLTTTNVTSLRIDPWPRMAGTTIVIDGQTLSVPANHQHAYVDLERRDLWQIAKRSTAPQALAKRPKLQGPIDDVFLAPFLVVTPTGKSKHAEVQAWIDFELPHFQQRWQALYRGQIRTKADIDVTAEDIRRYHLVVWGDANSNLILRRAISAKDLRLPIRWTEDVVEVGTQRFAAAHHVPVLIHPNPLNPTKYLVLNSGPTFREGHDRTNSLQNPKLPDWAVIDLSQAPSDISPGKIVAADFFDERWQLKNDQE
jgi:dienelactone hydrolase